MISSVPARTTIRSVFSSVVAGCEPFTANRTLPGTLPSTPPIIPPADPLMECRPDRTCLSVLNHGRMLFWCHADAESTEMDVNPVAFCKAMPRRSFRQFMNMLYFSLSVSCECRNASISSLPPCLAQPAGVPCQRISFKSSLAPRSTSSRTTSM